MPECTVCDKYLAPNAVDPDGTCPTCGAPVHASTPTKAAGRIPWHFWLVFGFAGIYLGWRAVEGAIWLVQQVL